MPHPLTQILAHPQTFSEAIDKLYQWASGTQKYYVSTITAYTVMRGLEDQRIFSALKHADMRTADGMPLVWIQHYQGFKSAERVYGPNVMLALCGKKNVSHFLYGGLPGIPEKLTASLQQKFPDIQIVGAFSPPIAEVGTTPDPEIVEMLNRSGAQVVWVGLGSPKQDLWMELYRPILNAPLLIGVGAAFDFHSGTKTQAPQWIQKSSLEWLFRLTQEPGRLWRRYFVYNFRFVRTIITLYMKREL